MTLKITPDMLARAYDFLSSTAPFDRWNMPDSDDVTFRVSNGSDCGWCDRKRGRRPEIAISSRRHGHTLSLLMTMAHEMVHLHMDHCRMATSGVEHSAAFHKLAAQVCKHHGFDPKAF